MTEKFTSIAIGAFDGLHLGHMKVINSAINEQDLIPAVLTFKDDPSLSLEGESAYIITHEEKEEILFNAGVQKIFDLDFSEIRDMSPSDFFVKIILEKCKAKAIFCGKNFRFGKKASGNIKTLEDLCEKFQVKCNVIDFELEEEMPISSTRIRLALRKGDIKLANKLLGRNFGFEFTVVQGNQIGRTIGVPTINQEIPKGFALPKFGVYASKVTFEGQVYCGVTNIGTKPTIGKYDPLSETWILDFDEDVYGKKIKVELLDFIRTERVFKNVEELSLEIHKNAENAKEIFAKSLYK